MNLKNNKKGVELSLQTVVTFIILLIVVIVMVVFFSDHFISGSSSITDTGSGFINGSYSNS